MRFEGVEEVNEWLVEVGALGENLLHGLRALVGERTAEITFDVFFDPMSGRVLENHERFRVFFLAEGLNGLTFRGDLNEFMLDRREEIGWGLSEVARVSVKESNGLVALVVDWESERVIEVLCSRLVVELPDSWRELFFGRELLTGLSGGCDGDV